MDIGSYVTLYRELAYTGSEIIKLLHGALVKCNNDVDGFDDIKEFKQNDSSFDFRFFDFKICIEFKVCTSKEEVFIEWYLDKKDFLDPERQLNLIIKDSVDRNSNIKSSMIKDKGYNPRYAKLYFMETLMIFCEKIDEYEFNKKASLNK
jgi:hypothetical protein